MYRDKGINERVKYQVRPTLTVLAVVEAQHGQTSHGTHWHDQKGPSCRERSIGECKQIQGDGWSATWAKPRVRQKEAPER
jgi:hypothetical protein